MPAAWLVSGTGVSPVPCQPGDGSQFYCGWDCLLLPARIHPGTADPTPNIMSVYCLKYPKTT